MLRISQYMREIHTPAAAGPARAPTGPVVIWNLVRRCNLCCEHCYSISADRDFPGELSTREVYDVMDDLRKFGVPVLIFSGGEPLLRPDLFDIARRAKSMGFYVGLSSNGTLIGADNIERIAQTQYAEQVDKFYLSHLNYAGRGNINRRKDAFLQTTRQAMDLVFDACWNDMARGVQRDYVTGNNDADGVYLLFWMRRRFPHLEPYMRRRLGHWGGNASGTNIANIDNLGNVHPDTYWWHYSLGNVRDRPFSEIWNDVNDAVMAGLKRKPRVVKGRCGACAYFDICGGNTRVRALQVTGDAWAEDPACYLTDAEIGIAEEETLTA